MALDITPPTTHLAIIQVILMERDITLTHTPLGIILTYQATHTHLDITLMSQGIRIRQDITLMSQGIRTQQDITQGRTRILQQLSTF